MEELVGIYEIAVMAGVTSSAVSNWRMRFQDFPLPVVELKSGPIFRKALVHAWISKRDDDVSASMSLYEQLAGKRSDDTELRESVAATVKKMQELGTSASRPGMLLGRVQSGKTRAFLGVIAKAFDVGYDIAVILTKGTTSLAKQTLSRVVSDFEDFIEAEQVQAYDIMKVPSLTQYDLGRKLIIVAKKEDDNLTRLLNMFRVKYPELCLRKLLLIDDEADFSSVSFSTNQGLRRVGVISNQIDQLRLLVRESSFLQVTATPYSLYLQPELSGADDGNSLFLPKRPAFTVILPSHDKYVGGDQYFREVDDPESSAQYLYREVPLKELDALKKPDGRRLGLDGILTEKNVSVLRSAIMLFVVGGSIRRLQQAKDALKPERYSFLFHTEQKRDAHAWQFEVAEAIRKQLVVEAAAASPEYHGLVTAAYHDLARSVILSEGQLPSLSEVTTSVTSAFTTGQIMVTVVNSDKDVDLLLDSGGQLHLRNPFNIFIGGQILDRGITIKNLIGFYYGKPPKRFQQDTVLQHSRMYGARSRSDLTVTRFFAPLHIYKIMRKINDFDSGLRLALLDNDNSQGVYFIQRDISGQLIPCAPNKLKFSEITTIRPGQRLLPVGFNTVSVTEGRKPLAALDAKISLLSGVNTNVPVLVGLSEAVDVLRLSYRNLVLDADASVDERSMIAAIEHLSNSAKDLKNRGKVWVMAVDDRNTSRSRVGGRLSNAPDTKQQADLALKYAEKVPVLMLFRQNGLADDGWRGLPFWWPVAVAPLEAVTTVCASGEPI